MADGCTCIGMERATTSELRKKLKHLIARAVAGDAVVVEYSRSHAPVAVLISYQRAADAGLVPPLHNKKA